MSLHKQYYDWGGTTDEELLESLNHSPKFTEEESKKFLESFMIPTRKIDLHHAPRSLENLRKQSTTHRWLEQQFEKEWLDSVERELQALLETIDIIKELFDFDFATKFPNNQPMLMITNKHDGSYFEIPITKEKYDLLKEMLS